MRATIDGELYVDVDDWCVAPTLRGMKGWHEATLTLTHDPRPLRLELRVDRDGRVVIPATARSPEQVTAMRVAGPMAREVQLSLRVDDLDLDARLFGGRDGFVGAVALLVHPVDPELWGPGPAVGELVVVVGPTPPAWQPWP